MKPLKLIRRPSEKLPSVGLHLIAILALALALQASAATVYKYRDENGAITYSDSPPTHTDDYEIIEIQSSEPSDPQAHQQMLEQMAKTSDRLQADRRQREEDRQKTAQSRSSAPPYYPATAQPEPDYYPGYPFLRRNYHRTSRPPYRNERETVRPDNPLDRVRTPLKIPSYGTGENFRQRHGVEN
ncbi:MAG: DUF4124 domain-containing protein [Porticoccaceae bacterium]|nr:DUF4124 domain-containing protein [Porticoccaceae bacterium]